MHIERPHLCTCPPLSHVHSPIGTNRHFSAVKISLQPTCCPPRGIAVDDHADGAIFRPWLHLDNLLQRSRYAARGVESTFVPCQYTAHFRKKDVDKNANRGLEIGLKVFCAGLRQRLRDLLSPAFRVIFF